MKSFLNYGVVINGGGGVRIENNVSIGMGVKFITATHQIGDSNRRAGHVVRLPIVVEDGCWIGANSIILPDVTIGNGCIIVAGSLVNKDCDPNGLYAGLPAKRVRDLKP